jgi:hypothetical protein
MKQYVGTKTVKAMLMTKGEAYLKGLLRAGVVPNETEKKLEGYNVRYEGGYESWSPKSTFEAAYQPADTPLERMEMEFEELACKIHKLELFLGKEGCEMVAGEGQTCLMKQQLKYMSAYLDVLRSRIILMEEAKG